MNAAATFEKTRKQTNRDAQDLQAYRERKGKRNRTVRGQRVEWEAV